MIIKSENILWNLIQYYFNFLHWNRITFCSSFGFNVLIESFPNFTYVTDISLHELPYINMCQLFYFVRIIQNG